MNKFIKRKSKHYVIQNKGVLQVASDHAYVLHGPNTCCTWQPSPYPSDMHLLHSSTPTNTLHRTRDSFPAPLTSPLINSLR